MNRVERILPEIRVECLVAAVLEGTEEDIQISQVARAEQINWWGYGLEMIIQAIQSYLTNIADYRAA